MRRHTLTVFLAFLAAGLVFATPAVAGDDALREKVRQLEEKVEALSGQQSTQLEQAIEQYLDESSAWQAAAAGTGVEGVTISADFTANTMGTVSAKNISGQDINRTVVTGFIDLKFDMKVTENLDFHIHLTANTADPVSNLEFLAYGEFEAPSLEAITPSNPALQIPTPGFPTMLPNGGRTLSGWTDGIGVDGTQPVQPGSITVWQAYITHKVALGRSNLYTELGSMDPRFRFLQNAFADDEKTQFVNNIFDDPAAMLWLTDASGRTPLGIYQWMNFGDKEQFTVSWGWFNTPGQFFDKGQFMIQFGWAGEVKGRAMNLYILGFLDNFYKDSTGDGSSGGGFSWDWAVSEKIGVWARLTATGGDVNVVSMDAEVGVHFMNFAEARPDDTAGFAFGWIKANDSSQLISNSFTEDTELVLELYYRYTRQDGKLQITPYFMYVSNPGGGESFFGDDKLFILGLRVHVPF
jgi:hypothetical protein